MSEEGRARPYMDWQQVILNGGPPCFAVLDGEETWYCGRAQRWVGHDGEHKFISLDDLISAAERRGRDEQRERDARIAEEHFVSGAHGTHGNRCNDAIAVTIRSNQ